MSNWDHVLKYDRMWNSCSLAGRTDVLLYAGGHEFGRLNRHGTLIVRGGYAHNGPQTKTELNARRMRDMLYQWLPRFRQERRLTRSAIDHAVLHQMIEDGVTLFKALRFWAVSRLLGGIFRKRHNIKNLTLLNDGTGTHK
jgi:hypothetical protein